MNVTTFRTRATASPAPRRIVLVAFLALVAVLFGLLAMHSIAAISTAVPVTGHTHAIVDDSAPARADMEMTASAASGTPALAPVCADACQLGCLMFGVMCTVTMAAVLTLRLYQRSSPRVLPATLMRVSALVSHHMAFLKPPSLVILSISRT
jgi:hypothetical protein